MEQAVYYAAIAALIAFGLYAGHRRARSMGHAVLLGLVGTVVAILAFFFVTAGLAIVAPGSIDPDDMGFRLGALLLFGSAVGAVAAIGSRRHAVKMATRLLGGGYSGRNGGLPETGPARLSGPRSGGSNA